MRSRFRLRGKIVQLKGALALGLTTLFLLCSFRQLRGYSTAVHQVLPFDPYVDFSRPDVAHDLCSQHGWKPFRSRETVGPKRKIYDLFMVNTELDWLEIRLNTTYDFVDYFVIVESPKTFTNHDKPLVIKESLDKLAAYATKIIYHELEIPPDFNPQGKNPAWAWEDLQRNAMYDQVLPRLEGVQAPVDGDVIIVADVDEIIRPDTLVVLKTCEFPRRLNLRSSFYYYSFQFLHEGPQWAHPQATYYQGWRTIAPAHLRGGDGGLFPFIRWETEDLWDAGWHCSSCFSTIQELLTKMASFSHVSFNQEYFRNPDYIATRVREGQDIWNRPGEVFRRINNNQDIPQILLNEKEKFSYLLDRDGISAGFQDYP
ncbi:glycosyltransferase family 17 protein [Xylariales sp. PMI_506]|nr:glycosyltransferase family 17 protein [Xylariales sp. PMI_506]